MKETTAQFNGFQFNNNTVLGRRRFKAPFTYKDSLINEARLIHIFSGYSTLNCAGKIINLKPGDTLIMKADNFVNQWQKRENNNVDFVGFRLTQPLIQTLYKDNIPSQFILNSLDTSLAKVESAHLLSQSALMNNFFASLRDYIEQRDVMTEAMVGLKLRELIELMLWQDKDKQLALLLKQIFVPNQPKLQEVVHQHICSPLKVEELAFLCHMSTSTFNRKFKQIYGTSANKYLNTKRLEKAKSLITSSDKSLTEIALQCGYEESSYFSKSFKQFYGTSPSDYRKQAT